MCRTHSARNCKGAQVLNKEHVNCMQMGQVIKPKSMHAHSRSPHLLTMRNHARPESASYAARQDSD